MFYRSSKGLLALLAVFTGLSPLANAAQTTGSSGAQITQPIQIIATRATVESQGLQSRLQAMPQPELVEWGALYFGTISTPQNGAGEVVLGPMGQRTCGGGVECIESDYHAARFAVTGTAGAYVSVSVPSTITISNGVSTLQIVEITLTENTLVLTGGVADFCLGGTLQVPASATPGDYSGTYIVSVEYM